MGPDLNTDFNIRTVSYPNLLLNYTLTTGKVELLGVSKICGVGVCVYM